MRIVEPNVHLKLDDYAAYAHLRADVAALRADAERVAPLLRGRTIWMVNSTAQGGGVAELLPAHVSILCQLGIETRWVVLETTQVRFFEFTKRLHNLIHAVAAPAPTASDRALYEAVNRDEATALAQLLAPSDILLVHDPQPLPLGAYLKQERGVLAVWRCHIGVDETTEATRTAWTFLRRYLDGYDGAVFSVRDYIPDYLHGTALVIHPSIDPLSHKNRELSLHKLTGILGDADLVEPHWPLNAPPFEQRARRLQSDGAFAAATHPEDIGLLARPIVTQVSRWDRLKGFAPLLDAFVLLKTAQHPGVSNPLHRRRLENARLVLAGADPDAIPDDPEGQAVFGELRAKYLALSPELQRDIAIIALPTASRKQNALMVNALQRASDIVVQNSLREGFGLTVSEAMWKRIPVLGSATACGVRLQVRDHTDGRLVSDPEDPAKLARTLIEMSENPACLAEYGRNAQYRVHDKFLMFGELQQWLGLFRDVAQST